MLHQTQAVIQGVKFATLEIDLTRERALVSVGVEVEHFAGDKPNRAAITLLHSAAETAVVEIEIDLNGEDGTLGAEQTLQIEQPNLW